MTATPDRDSAAAPAAEAVAARRELGGVAALGGVALAAFVFLRLGSEVAEGETHRFDTAIMLALRQPGDLAQPVGPPWLHLAMLDLTALGGTAVLTLVTCAAIGFLLAQRRWGRAGFVGVAIGGAALFNLALKTGYARPRPELVAHLVTVSSTSFPSGHAMNAAVTYLTLGVLLARAVPERRVKLYLAGVAVTLTIIVGVSRVYLGVHYPTDVLAGWTIGAGWAALCWLAEKRLRGRAATAVEAG